MEILTGRPASPGFAKGTAVVIDDDACVEIPRYTIDQWRQAVNADAEPGSLQEAEG